MKPVFFKTCHKCSVDKSRRANFTQSRWYADAYDDTCKVCRAATKATRPKRVPSVKVKKPVRAVPVTQSVTAIRSVWRPVASMAFDLTMASKGLPEENLVGAIGLEPTTPTMSRLRVHSASPVDT